MLISAQVYVCVHVYTCAHVIGSQKTSSGVTSQYHVTFSRDTLSLAFPCQVDSCAAEQGALRSSCVPSPELRLHHHTRVF